MKILFKMPEISEVKSTEKFPLECYGCGFAFKVEVKHIRSELKLKRGKCKYCSKRCQFESMRKTQLVSCGTCNKLRLVDAHVLKNSKSGKIFCDSSCAAKFNNRNKTTGTRRSKLEVWLEEQFKSEYPQLEVKYNQRSAINAELDIFIPSLKLAVELNGIFHYEPIFGQEKLSAIKSNDDRKFQACLEQGIELVIIDVSSLKYFTQKNTAKYWDILRRIIDTKLTT